MVAYNKTKTTTADDREGNVATLCGSTPGSRGRLHIMGPPCHTLRRGRARSSWHQKLGKISCFSEMELGWACGSNGCSSMGASLDAMEGRSLVARTRPWNIRKCCQTYARTQWALQSMGARAEQVCKDDPARRLEKLCGSAVNRDMEFSWASFFRFSVQVFAPRHVRYSCPLTTFFFRKCIACRS